MQPVGAGFGGASQNALRLFERFDADGSGTLDMNEARNALRWANFVDDSPQGVEELNRLFHRFDLDRNGTLDLREFSRLVVACEQGDAY
jgi:Ca2+-binding EF-hand superfamily protein